MSKTITLPDHISFEELARVWCAEWEHVIRFRWEVYIFYALKKVFFKKTTSEALAVFYPLSRNFTCFKGDYEDELTHLITFIEERSNV